VPKRTQCKDCGSTDIGWSVGDNLGSRGCRCRDCYRAYERARRRPPRNSAADKARRDRWLAKQPPKPLKPKQPKPKLVGPPIIRFTRCLGCSDMIRCKSARTKRCAECSRRHNIGRTMGLYRAASETGKVRQAMMWRYVLVDYLRERDGDKCGLCAKKITFGVTTGPRGADDEGPSIDHIHPRSHGGSDDLANLQLAHWSCNRAKGNRGEAEQLRLVG
jgi:5-methylcytosine-specific restriction endonuclease McrA